MKKLIGTVAVAALLATAAFAEINFGAWLRVLAVPVAGNGDDILSGMTNSWGWGARTARLNVNAVSEDEKIGFSMGVYNDAWDGLSAGDDYVIWAKPWDFLKISFGKWDYTAFRGDLSFGSWNWVRPNNWLFGDEGLTFDQLGNQNGIQFELTPIEGLVVMWNLPLAKGFTAFNDESGEKDKEHNTTNASTNNYAYKMFQKQDIAVKYTIGDIGTIKAGWEGQASKYEGDAKKLADINAAFDLTAVENLYITVGVKFPIVNGDYKDANSGYNLVKAAIGASYQILDNLKVSASYGMQTYKKYDSDNKKKPDHQFGVGVDVGFTDALSLTADFRALIPTGSKVMGNNVDGADPQFSFLVGLQYTISSNGYIGIGFQGSTGGCGLLSDSWGINPYKKDSFCWAVPVAISCWF